MTADRFVDDAHHCYVRARNYSAQYAGDGNKYSRSQVENALEMAFTAGFRCRIQQEEAARRKEEVDQRQAEIRAQLERIKSRTTSGSTETSAWSADIPGAITALADLIEPLLIKEVSR